jgi:hypothetical protein
MSASRDYSKPAESFREWTFPDLHLTGIRRNRIVFRLDTQRAASEQKITEQAGYWRARPAGRL